MHGEETSSASEFDNLQMAAPKALSRPAAITVDRASPAASRS
jgi:hypothetical protein